MIALFNLYNSYIDKMIKKGATSKEIDFILHIALYQDMSGTVESVYYKDICNAISVSHTKFYDILNSLSEKELISYKKLNRADVCVQLLENDFRGNSFKKGSKGYLKVGEIDFVKKEFRDLKAGAKLLYLYMQRFKQGKHMLVGNFYEEFSKRIQCAEKSIQKYLRELKENGFLYVSKKRNKAFNYEMTMKISYELHSEKNIQKEHSFYLENIKELIRRNFARYMPEDIEEEETVLKDIADLTKAKRAAQHKDFVSLIVDAASCSIKQQKKEKKKNPKLNAALVNTHLTELLRIRKENKLQIA